MKSRSLFLLFSSISLLIKGQIMYPGDVTTITTKETVYDYSASKCDADMIMDGSPHLYRDAANKIQLLVPGYKQWRISGSDFSSLAPDCATGAVHSSDMDPNKANHNYQEWLFSPYTTDGITINALIHNEYHGYDFTGECSSTDVLKCWYNSITSTSSSDSGKTFSHASAPNHLVAAVPYVYDKDHGYRQGAFSPSNIIKHQTDGYYYAFFHTEAQGDQTDGLVLMRTLTLNDPTSWRIYNGTDFSAQTVNPYTDTFTASEKTFHVINGTKSVGRVVWSSYFQKYLNAYLKLKACNHQMRGYLLFF